MKYVRLKVVARAAWLVFDWLLFGTCPKIGNLQLRHRECRTSYKEKIKSNILRGKGTSLSYEHASLSNGSRTQRVAGHLTRTGTLGLSSA